jgi:hypothetical protein
MRPLQFLAATGSGCMRHARARLGAEVLHDDFLDMAVPHVQLADGEQGLDALARGSRRCRSGCRW